MRITEEVGQGAREKNILKEEDMVKPKEAKPIAPTPKQRKSRSATPSSSLAKPARKPKPSKKSFDGGEKKIKTIIFVTMDDEKTKSNEIVRGLKGKGVKATKITKEKPYGGPKYDNISKTSKIDEAL